MVIENPQRLSPPDRPGRRQFAGGLLAGSWAMCRLGRSGAAPASTGSRVPILLYHQIRPVAANAMTVTPSVLTQQLAAIRDGGYRVIPLRQLIDYRLGQAVAPAAGSIAITVDDGWASVFEEMFPLLQAAGIPATMFVSPSTISHLPYAMTWEQLATMKASGMIDVQSHGSGHPNFQLERQRLSEPAYEAMVRDQLGQSRHAIAERLGGPIDILAWPYGIHDATLRRMAREAGYVAAVAVRAQPASDSDDIMALPRYTVTNDHTGTAFQQLLDGH